MTFQLSRKGKLATDVAIFWDISEKGEMHFWAKIDGVLSYF